MVIDWGFVTIACVPFVDYTSSLMAKDNGYYFEEKNKNHATSPDYIAIYQLYPCYPGEDSYTQKGNLLAIIQFINLVKNHATFPDLGRHVKENHETSHLRKQKEEFTIWLNMITGWLFSQSDNHSIFILCEVVICPVSYHLQYSPISAGRGGHSAHNSWQLCHLSCFPFCAFVLSPLSWDCSN